MADQHVCEFCVESKKIREKCHIPSCNFGYTCKYCIRSRDMSLKCVSYKCKNNPWHDQITKEPEGYVPNCGDYKCRACHEKECSNIDEDGHGYCFCDLSPIEFWECEHKK